MRDLYQKDKALSPILIAVKHRLTLWRA